MTEDARRAAAIQKFYEVYRELQKYDSLRLRTRMELGGEALIEITRYSGENPGDRILRITQEDEAIAYEQATDQLINMLDRRRKDRKAGQRGA